MKLIGRGRILRRLGNYAIEEPENKAFFGVKGLGKSAIMDAVFSKKNCRHFADEYHYLYVRTILMPEKTGDDLVDFLLDRVLNGVDLIEDEALRSELQVKIQSDKERFQSKDSVLVEALSEDVLKHVCSIIGGIPGFVLPAIKSMQMMDGQVFVEEDFILHMLSQPKCASLLTSWCRSLAEQAKRHLLVIAIK